MTALIITGRMVQDQELIVPFYRLQEAGYAVTVAAESQGTFHGIQGVKFHADASLQDEAEALDDYELLVIPGGVKCMEHLRLNQAAVFIVKEMHRRGAVIGSVCSGAQMLITAKVIKGRKISAYPAMQVDVENAGAKFQEGVTVDGCIVSAPHYRDLGLWMAALLREMERSKFSLEGAACAAAL